MHLAVKAFWCYGNVKAHYMYILNKAKQSIKEVIWDSPVENWNPNPVKVHINKALQFEVLKHLKQHAPGKN